jgi:hypothetical protein
MSLCDSFIRAPLNTEGKTILVKDYAAVQAYFDKDLAFFTSCSNEKSTRMGR